MNTKCICSGYCAHGGYDNMVACSCCFTFSTFPHKTEIITGAVKPNPKDIYKNTKYSHKHPNASDWKQTTESKKTCIIAVTM